MNIDPIDATYTGIAIVGASCRLPGAPDLEAFENLLAQSIDAVSEIPDGRWSKSLFYNPDPKSQGKSYTFAAGCLEQVDQFDPGFFGISPREAVQMDPQQRLLLELTLEALEDSGIRPSSLAGSRTSVHVGGSSSDYVTMRLGDPGGADAYFMTGSTLCSLANRVSHAFNLRGASFNVDSACSSSLVALHLAVEGLRSGEADIALVGGVNLLLAPQSFIGFSRAGMLSPTGRCHAFDSRADGYVRAEGGGVLVLKSVGAALADGNRIHAVICATGVNSDGHTAGFSLPSEAAQAALLQDVYDRAGISAADLVYLEAHGTGTPVGDPIEAAAIGRILGAKRQAPLPIGSVKTNVGHLEAGSGMAGLLKLIVAMRARRVPASLHLAAPNPAIPFAALNLTLVGESLALPPRGTLIMGINSFGFGGTNAHAVLRTPPSLNALLADAGTPPMLLLSARSPGALDQLAAMWRDTIAHCTPNAFAPLLRGAARRREHYSHRLVVLASDSNTMSQKLSAYTDKKSSASVLAGVALREPGRLAFAYCGNASQWAGMAQDAMSLSAAFADMIDTLEPLLAPLLRAGLRSAGLREAGLRDALMKPDAAALRRTEIAQPLLFAIQVASVTALHACGIVADAHVGHSVGEVAAAWASGALTLEDAVLIIAQRSRLQQQTHAKGRMAALALPEDQAREAIASSPGLTIAAVNARASVTVAGDVKAVETLAERAEAAGWGFVPLDLDYAFHSPAMAPIRDELIEGLAEIAPRPTYSILASSVTGKEIAGDTLTAEHWWRNVRDTVRFSEAASALVRQGVRIFVEIGPQAVLQGFLRDALAAEAAMGAVVPSLTRRQAALDPLMITAARLHVAGHSIDGNALFDGPAAHDGLPHYPWQRERFWFDRTTEATDLLTAISSNDLLGFARNGENDGWFNHIDLSTREWLADHVVDGSVLLPAAAMIDMALAACLQAYPAATAHEILDLRIDRPVVFERGSTVELSFTPTGSEGRFMMRSRRRLAAEPADIYASGRMRPLSSGAQLRPMDESAPVSREIGSAEFYVLAATVGLQYGPAFQSVQRVLLTGPGRARIDLHQGRAPGPSVVDPTLLDGAMQALAAMATHGGFVGRMTILPFRFGRVRLLTRNATPRQALLHITLAGPRSVCANILLLDEDSRPLLELVDCWFVAIPATGLISVVDHLLYSALVPTLTVDPIPDCPSLGLTHLTTCLPQEPLLLADAFLSSMAYRVISEVVRPGVPIEPTELAAAGTITVAGINGLGRSLSWLEQDGAACLDKAGTYLAESSGLPSVELLFGSMFFDHPAHLAEAALLAHMNAACSAVLHSSESTPLPPTLVDQLLNDSPSARVMLEALELAFADWVAAWPPDRKMRVLVVEAGSDALTRRLVRLLANNPGCSYVALTVGDDAGATLLQTLRPIAGARVLALESAEAATLRDFDIAAGLHAVACNPALLSRLQSALRPGANVLLAEPAPSRLFDALGMFGLHCSPLAGSQWSAILDDAGFTQRALTAIATPFWPALLICATCVSRLPVAAQPCIQRVFPPATMPSTIIHRLGNAREFIGLEAACRGARCSLPEWPTSDRALLDAAVLLVVLPTPDNASLTLETASVLGALAALAEVFAELDQCIIVLALRGASSGDPFAAAIQGFRRVLVNEAGNIRCRLLRLDTSFDDAEANELIRCELAVDDGEDEISWTPSGRFVIRLRTAPTLHHVTESVALVATRPGMIAGLEWQAQTERKPGPGEVLIEVSAAGLNFRDVMWALGLLPDEALIHGLSGATLGLECAGRILAIGPEVDTLRPGMRVMGLAPASLSTRCVTRAGAVVPIPSGLNDVEAATMPVAFLTVLYALGTLGRLSAGETVLIHGAAGGVGLAAVQYARYCGAVIVATAGTMTKQSTLHLLGVDHVLDSRSLDFADEVMRLTAGRGVDVVLNSLSGEAMQQSLGLLAPFGRFLELGKRDLYGDTSVGLRPLRNNATYFAIDADQLPVLRGELATTLLGKLAELVDSAAFRPLPYRRFEYGEVQKAFRLMQASHHIGKIVLTPDRGQQPPLVAADFAASADATYVLTGALSGFGRRAALWLVHHGARHVVVLSRRGPADPQAASLAAELAVSGATLLCLSCDVGEEAALSACLNTVRAEMPPIRGVLHCAMILDDALLPQLDYERIATVLQPKLAGALALDRLTRTDPIDMFVLFSSIVTMLGNPGQAAYVAANSAMEALAERRKSQGLPALAVGWSPIADAGILARDKATNDRLARRLGSNHMTADQALAALPLMLASRVAVVAYAEVPWHAARGGLPLLTGPLVADLVFNLPDEIPVGDLRTALIGMSPELAGSRVARLLIEQVAEILQLTPDRIDADMPLSELGMDSLMAVELRLSMESNFGLSLPLLSLGNGVTAAMLGERVIRSLIGTSKPLTDAIDSLIERHGDTQPAPGWNTASKRQIASVLNSVEAAE